MAKGTFALPDGLMEELDRMAAELGKKKSHIVAEALEYYFDLMDLRIAKHRSEELRSKKVEPIPFDRIAKEYGL